MSARQRSYAWEDPAATAAAGMQMAGLDYLRAMQEGTLPAPPICATIGFRFVEFDEGWAVMEFDPAEYHYNPIGTVHGSVIVALLDSVAGSAVHSTLPAGVGYTTVSLTTSFLKAVRSDTGTLRAEGRLLKSGRRIALSEASLADEEGRVHAHAIANSMIIGGP